MAKAPAKKRFASPRAEFLSAAFMSFWMNNIGVELALIKPFLENRAGFKDVDTQQLFLALLFVHLCFLAYMPLKPPGALNNPAVYFLFYLLGDADGATARNGAASAIGGTVLGTFAYAQCIKAVAGGVEASSRPSPAGRAGRSGCERSARRVLQLRLRRGLARLVGAQMAPYAGAFFYVATITIEKCAYSCGFMNPAVVLATTRRGGGRVHEKKRGARRDVRRRRGAGRARRLRRQKVADGNPNRPGSNRAGKAKASAARGGKSDPKKKKSAEREPARASRAKAQAQGGVNVSARRSTFNNSLCQ